MFKPNVLFITTDQMRKDHMGCAGNPVIRTPSLDRLAAGGVLLERCYVNNPVCMPNRSTMATGRLPRNHRCWWNGIDLPDNERTIGDVLADNGYHTALLGKPHFRITAMPYDKKPRGIENGPAWEQGLNDPNWSGPYYGFQYVQFTVGHAWANLNRAHMHEWVKRKHPEALARQFDWEPSPTGAPESYIPRYPAEAHSSNWLGEIGSEYIRQRGADGRPFMLWVSFPDPHHPFCPPKPYDTMYDPARVPMPRIGPEALADKPPQFMEAYTRRWKDPGAPGLADMTAAQVGEMIARTYGMITLVDENIGRILDALEQSGLAENTIVIFTSDHGDLMGDMGLILKGPWLLEGLINIPMIWRMPGACRGRLARDSWSETPGTVTNFAKRREISDSPQGSPHVHGLFSSCDIAPTILELLGIDVPRAMDGLPQGQLVCGDDSAGKRDAAFVEYRTPDAENIRTIITADRKLTYYPSQPYGELYDLGGWNCGGATSGATPKYSWGCSDGEASAHPEAKNLYNDPTYAADRAALEKRLLDELILREDRRLWPTAGA